MAFQSEENFMTPPQTPRRQPMSTPIVDRFPPMDSPPQLEWQPGAALPVNDLVESSEQLTRALDKGSIHDIQRVLDADPDAAWMPVLMDGMQPPLCAAIRLHCDLKVVKLLIARGANVGMVNSHGQGPLSVLASCRCAVGFEGYEVLTALPDVPDFDKSLASLPDLPDFDVCPSPWHNTEVQREPKHEKMENWILSVAVQLLQAGCSITDKDSSGRIPIQVARDNGLPKLASLIQEWQDSKTCAMFKRMASRSTKENPLDCFQRLPSSLVCHLLEFVAAENPTRFLSSTVQS